MAKFLKPILLFIALQLPSYRVMFKFLPHHFIWLIPVFWIFIFVLYYSIFNQLEFRNLLDRPYLSLLKKGFQKSNVLLHSNWLAAILILLLFATNFVFYPIVDALKFQGRGSDQDDAIIVVCKALFTGHSPYDVLTYRGNPPSPGPGLILILSPFVLLKLYALATPFFVAFTSFLIWFKTRSIALVNTFLLLLISAPAFWELAINGSDFLIIGCLLSWPMLLWRRSGISPLLKIVLFAFIALVLTSRIFFVYLIPIFAILLNNRNGYNIKEILFNLLIISILTFGIHLIFYLPDSTHYSPMHLIGKGQRIAGTFFIMVSIVSGLALGFFTLKRYIEMPFFILWVWLFIPMFILTMAVLNVRGFNLLGYPISYLVIQIPVAIISLLMNKDSSKIFRENVL